MKRAVDRAYRRLKGAHPRRPPSRISALVELGCDLLLLAAATGLLGGIGVLVWAGVSGLHLSQLVTGAALIVAGAVLLLSWERIAWEPFVEELSEHLSELS